MSEINDDDDIFVVEKICETVVGFQSAVEVFFSVQLKIHVRSCSASSKQLLY